MTNMMMTLDMELQNLITKTVAMAETTEEFVITEAPQVVEQLLAWNFTYSLFWFILSSLTCLGFLLGVKKLVSMSKLDGAEILLSLGAVISFIFMLLNITWIKIAIAPKFYLLEYATDLIK